MLRAAHENASKIVQIRSLRRLHEHTTAHVIHQLQYNLTISSFHPNVLAEKKQALSSARLFIMLSLISTPMARSCSYLYMCGRSVTSEYEPTLFLQPDIKRKQRKEMKQTLVYRTEDSAPMEKEIANVWSLSNSRKC
jgi:hypothetical protein